MFNFVRRNFITGFFVTVPLVISVAALVWIFRLIDGLVGPIYERGCRGRFPGLGLLTTALVVLLVGTSRPTSSASGCCSGPRAT